LSTLTSPGTLNAAFTRKARRPKPKRRVENDEFGAFARRIIRAYGRRVGEGDVEALASLIRLHDELGEVIATAAGDLHARGYSWAEIAARTGTSLQAVRQRVMRRTMRSTSNTA
jgi:hypothetical protein